MDLAALAGRDTAEAAAPREVPNYAPMLLWAIWAVTIVSAVFLGLRVYCKVTRHRALWWDDGFLILSWVSALRCLGRTMADHHPDLHPRVDSHAHRGHQVRHRLAL